MADLSNNNQAPMQPERELLTPEQAMELYPPEIVREVQLKKTLAYLGREIARREAAGIFPPKIDWKKK